MRVLLPICGSVFLLTSVVMAQTSPDAGTEEDARQSSHVLSPIAESGVPPPIYVPEGRPDFDLAAHRKKVRECEKQIRLIRRQHFGRMRVEEVRAEGIARLKELTDPAAFQPMIELLAEEAEEKEDVRLGMLDHFAACDEAGQGALAWVAVYDQDASIRREATRRLTSPPPNVVLFIIDQALRSPTHWVANSASVLVGALQVYEAIPLLIVAQVGTPSGTEARTGDLAWIATQTQHAIVIGLQPVMGNGSGAFQPIVGRVSDGNVMRVQDAVAVIYRTVVHETLVSMTTSDWGQPTEHLAYDVDAWVKWYNLEYLAFKRASGGQSTPAGSQTERQAPR